MTEHEHEHEHEYEYEYEYGELVDTQLLKSN